MAPVVVLVFFSIFVGSLSASPQGSSLEAITAIDTDGNGKVSLQEIEVFGRTSGLTEQEIRTDFKELDSNADGELDSQEISGLLSPSSSGPAAVSAEAPPSAKAEPVFAAKAEPVLAPRAEHFLAPKARGNGESITTVAAQPVPAAKAVPVLPAKAEAVPVAEAMPVATAKTEPAVVAEANPATAAEAKPTLPRTELTKQIKKRVSNLEALKRDARRQTGAIIGAGLATRAQALIQQGDKDAKEAVLTEAKAVNLRGSVRAAANSVVAETLSASKAAVSAAATQGLAEAERLKVVSEELQGQAVFHHERAKQALLEASQAQMS